MPVSYRVFKHWREVERMPNSKDFMFYQTDTGSIIGIEYSGMLSVFSGHSKQEYIKKNAILTCALYNALSCGKKEGQINI